MFWILESPFSICANNVNDDILKQVIKYRKKFIIKMSKNCEHELVNKIISILMQIIVMFSL